jgi:hypothetical protein
MGKSKHRKNHKQKVASYKLRLRDNARRHVKFLKELRQKYMNEVNLINGPEVTVEA